MNNRRDEEIMDLEQMSYGETENGEYTEENGGYYEEQESGEYYAESGEYAEGAGGYYGEQGNGEYYAESGEYTESAGGYYEEQGNGEYYAESGEYAEDAGGYYGEQGNGEYAEGAGGYYGEQGNGEYAEGAGGYYEEQGSTEYYAESGEYADGVGGYYGEQGSVEYAEGSGEYYDEDLEVYGEEEELEKEHTGPARSRQGIMDWMMLAAGAGVILLVIITGVVFIFAKAGNRQTPEYISVGEQLDGIDVIGDQGLLAVANAAAERVLAQELLHQQEQQEEDQQKDYNESEYSQNVTVKIKTVSVQKDLKIKFVNSDTGKLIANVPFAVTVVTADQKTEAWSDDDMDGIIYKKGITPGDYSLTVEELKDEKYARYLMPKDTQKTEVKKDIAYQKIDVADEVKTEAQIDVATEEQKKQEPEVESTLTDTVQWVESTAVPSTYIEVSRKNITDPKTLVKSGNFLRMAKEVTLNKDEATLQVGGETLTLKVKHTLGDNAQVEWSSSNPGVASVKDGVVTPKAEGQTVITCSVTEIALDTDGGAVGTLYSAICKVTVEAEKSTESSSETPGEKPSEPSSETPGEKPSEPSSETSGEKPSEPSSETPGEKPSEPSSETPGEKPAVGTVSLSKDDVTVAINGTVKSKIKVKGFEEGKELVYEITSSNSDVAVASLDEEGKVAVTGVSIGTATVTVKANYQGSALSDAPSATMKVTVTDERTVKLDKKTVTVYISEPVTINATVTGLDSDNAVKAKSSDKEVVTTSVSDKVITITGVKVGTAVITVEYKDEDGDKISAECAVTVKEHPKNDNTSKLKDNKGNQLYVQENEGYREAVYADYYVEDMKFFIKGEMKYTGWNTIDGKVYFFDAAGNKITGEQVIQGAKYTFASDGSLVTGSGTMGIDVSKHNGDIDWNAVKNSGVSYVIIRCGYRGYTLGSLVIDSKFQQNIKGATAAGLNVGIYFFSQAVDEVEAVQEASYVLDAVKGYRISYPIFLDVEYSGAAGRKGRADGLDKETRTAVCRAFCATIQGSGYTAGVYANKTWLQTMIDPGQLSAYKIWLAQYSAEPSYSGRYDLWQYKSTGKVSGISGNVDMNLSYLGY